MTENNPFIVALRYTRAAGGYHGIITFTQFASEEAFDVWYTPSMASIQEVVEKGISEDRAMELVDQTPFACRIAAAKQEATDENGKVNPMIFDMFMSNAIFAEMKAEERYNKSISR